jgi:hypothetical protein
MTHYTRLALVLCIGLLGLSPAWGQWSSDPAQNLAVATGSGDQVLPLIGSTSDGGSYIAWFDGSTGSFRVFLQRLDAAGVSQFPSGGLLISDEPQNSALFGWDMIVDSDDHAVIVFSDIRDGGDLDIHAYRVAPDQTFTWGAGGVTLSSNPDFEPAPRVAQATDGDFVFVWGRDPATGDGDIRMQRLSPDGTPQLAAGGLAVVAAIGTNPGFADVEPADDGNVIVSWLKDITNFASDRHIRAQKFSPAGSPVWPAVVSVYDAFSVPIGYFPTLRADGAGGSYHVWHRSDGSFFNSFVQHLDSNGIELFPHNGVEVSLTPNMHHIDPALALSPASAEIFLFWNERVSNQSQWGIFAQRISAAGSRLWGSGGLQLLPVNTQFKSAPRAGGVAGGAVVFLVEDVAGSDRLIGMRLDEGGNQQWGMDPVVVSSAAGNKSRYPLTVDGAGSAKLTWEDDRNGTVDIYAQNVTAAGTLGVPPDAGHIDDTLRIGWSSTQPGHLALAWQASCGAGAVDYAIYEGALGSFYSHVMADCSDDGGDRTEDYKPQAVSSYYLVVPLSSMDEGSYGVDSNGVERPAPAAVDRCTPVTGTTGCAP